MLWSWVLRLDFNQPAFYLSSSMCCLSLDNTTTNAAGEIELFYPQLKEKLQGVSAKKASVLFQ